MRNTLYYGDNLTISLSSATPRRHNAYNILDKSYRWDTWAAPKGKDGKLDHSKAMTGDDLRDFVNEKFFPSRDH